MAPKLGTLMFPGESIDDLKTDKNGKTILGPGLRRTYAAIHIIKAGILQFKEPNEYWIESPEKRYIATKGDSVIGIVTQRTGDAFRIDIGASEQASLSYMAFEGATKKNRPDVKVGDIIYARLQVANKDMEPELVCMDSTGRSNGYGVIRDGGFMIKCPLHHIRRILRPNCPLLKTLGDMMPYETAVGINGRIWVKGRSTIETITIANIISDSEHCSDSDMKTFVKSRVHALSGLH
ncbi:hypothetical protein NP493_522g02033 [Ridgeia piscesae]|uniref:Exosome complex component RRP40 n=1 Tax=Ridgeia piscesae TaxID=27915 RepID=A0AAD9KWY5_RIDPI|nr:hypothetical protein NP493_522g02033 [Ridgeia piscesae]